MISHEPRAMTMIDLRPAANGQSCLLHYCSSYLSWILAIMMLLASNSVFAQNQVEVLYVIPQGQQPRPDSENVLTAIMVSLQRQYLEKLGKTFELAEPLVETVRTNLAPSEAVDWNKNVELIKSQAADGYTNEQNIVFSVLEGTDGPAGGSWNIVKMTGGFWDTAYKTYKANPAEFSEQLHGWSHELGHAFGLAHTTDARTCIEGNGGVVPEQLPSLVMQKGEDLGAVYNYGFIDAEKEMLLNSEFIPECLSFRSEPGQSARPHPSRFLRRSSVQRAEDGRSVALVEFRAPHGVGVFRLIGEKRWVEESKGGDTHNFIETTRDDWSVYLLDAARNLRIVLDLHRELVLYAVGDAEPGPLYPLLWAGSF